MNHQPYNWFQVLETGCAILWEVRPGERKLYFEVDISPDGKYINVWSSYCFSTTKILEIDPYAGFISIYDIKII